MIERWTQTGWKVFPKIFFKKPKLLSFMKNLDNFRKNLPITLWMNKCTKNYILVINLLSIGFTKNKKCFRIYKNRGFNWTWKRSLKPTFFVLKYFSRLKIYLSIFKQMSKKTNFDRNQFIPWIYWKSEIMSWNNSEQKFWVI